ncbi:hypothetical protein A33Q_2930 [Indibacter alkaliphilus LW1]|uniref:DUF4412 domain-containing protein n=1 Tax=Indibacter alkaliphilus (strain CCUG 57479 / KCTC 22604 / LW1) TaxID=1189612 RepID=S2E0K5_INDAL|nr:DUF4412 domain-containing protein [Indibacter alkaliphilus]EOZ95568.1 hypothetical protein A33Q_2930 [Indibacter alkaliphilus LW1]
MNRLRNAAERGVSRAIEKTVENEAEKLAQRQLQKAFAGLYGEDGMPGVDWDKVLSGISSDVEVADQYDFTGYTVLEITGKDSKGKDMDPMKMKAFLSEDVQVMGMEVDMDQGKKKKEDGTAIMIYDFSRNASIILMESEGEKQRMAYGIDLVKISEGIEVDEEDMPEEDFTFTKTGNTKTINGYACEEFVMDSEDAKASYWITQQPIKGNNTFWGNENPFLTSKMKSKNQSYFSDLPKGNLMEMYYESKVDKSIVDMKVIEINDNQKQVFKMSDYPSVFAGMQAAND